jgi:hypothetical protein
VSDALGGVDHDGLVVIGHDDVLLGAAADALFAADAQAFVDRRMQRQGFVTAEAPGPFELLADQGVVPALADDQRRSRQQQDREGE